MPENVIEEAAKALEAVERLLALGEPVPQEDPDIGAKVREIGVGLGFGAMMSSAQASWRKHLIAHGDPPGGEYAIVGCHAMVVKALEQTRSALASLRRLAAPAAPGIREAAEACAAQAVRLVKNDNPNRIAFADAFERILISRLGASGKEDEASLLRSPEGHIVARLGEGKAGWTRVREALAEAIEEYESTAATLGMQQGRAGYGKRDAEMIARWKSALEE